MNNKERLEILLKVRELRNDLNNLNFTNEEKEVLRRSYNYYESLLNLDIVRTNLNKEELDSMDVQNDIDVVEVPLDKNVNKYQEYSKLNDEEVITIVSKLSDTLNDKVALNALMEYCTYLGQVKLMKQNNQVLYDEIFEKSK